MIEFASKVVSTMEGRSSSLIDFVFSWSIQDSLNPNLYKSQVKKIPETFTSTEEYFSSFLAPLVEETHADLLSAMTRLSRAPSYQFSSIEREINYRAPMDFSYKIVLRKARNSTASGLVEYRPQGGDLAALTDVRPTCISDLNRPTMPFVLAYVQAMEDDKISIRSSKPIMIEQTMQSSQKKHMDLFFVFLTNVTTNIRIWKALHPDPLLGNLQMIYKIIHMNANDGEDCARCLFENNLVTVPSLESYGLNDSQEAAIASCIKTWRCCHQTSVKLIWGPPGTGKTKTISLLLLVLLGMKCQTITCAPTLIAVTELASRLVRLVAGTFEYETYGLGDIVLFGSSERMGMDDQTNLLHVFLDYRVEMLNKCFSPSSGWNTSLLSMINLLEDTQGQYGRYVAYRKLGINLDDNHEMEDENSSRGNETCEGNTLTLQEFVKKRFSVYKERLKFCVVNLYTHLPTHHISLKVVKNMMVALDSLGLIETLLNSYDYGDEGLRGALYDTEKESEFVGHFAKLRAAIKSCLPMLKSLTHSFQVPDITHRFLIKNICLDNACVLFCTASSSYKLNTERTRTLDLLVIDEAAQLKECESTIPFQLSGLRHAVLIGDERQLPAMIRSKISGEAGYGRSTFERLVSLGQKKHLFNVQYRMHPAISSFPNKAFYDGLILDATMVKHRSHEKRFLHGNMYGAYSFINVAYGKEQFGHLLSKKNVVEVAVVCNIVASLFKGFSATNQRMSIGIISPYTAQVHAIEERLEKKYSGYSDRGFTVSIRSVDGFQGGEQDVIIISTVRSNINGSIGFLSNPQRANVSLTRARHCLWILGNEATLVKSDSVWTKLVADAKRRGCFFVSDQDKHLAEGVVTALIELEQFNTLLTTDSPLFKHARWRVCFGDDFNKSVGLIKNKETHKQIIKVVEKLASGWRDEKMKHKDECSFGVVVEVYPVSGELNLVWSVEVETVKGDSEWIQVLKVWDMVASSDIDEAAHRLHILFAEYAENKISRCKHQCLEGNLVVPMKWAVQVQDERIEGHEDDKMECLSRRDGHEDDGMECLSRRDGNDDDGMEGLSRRDGNDDDGMECLSRRDGHAADGNIISSDSHGYIIISIIASVVLVIKYLPWPILFFITCFILALLIQQWGFH
ncbi:hypothetical protein V6N11_072014 [Hibiscus sabdariffa]|uniref:P-loop containing nucleoside triphosphate hydrolases superfamily protein n=1 Tax=Hibiscus sabdariffa TaxID=183260 RepID=A0ABR2U1R8_9ROSI